MNTSKAQRKFELYQRLGALGFTYDEAVALRRIEMTLQRWAEAECGDSNEYRSWSIEREEKTNKTLRVISSCGADRRTWVTKRYPIADRETGALKRLKAIVDARNSRECPPNAAIIPYHQQDCRGCMVYLIRAADVKDGESLDSIYTRGLAVCC
jgi:hypothetical protein